MDMVFHIRHQISQALAAMVAGAAIMHIAKGALDRVGARAIGRSEEKSEPRVHSQPWLDSFRLMDLIVIHHHLEPRVSLGRITRIEDAEQVPKPRVGFAWPTAVEPRPGCQIVL